MITGTKFEVGDFAIVFLKRRLSCVQVIGFIEEIKYNKDVVTYVVKHNDGIEEMLECYDVFSEIEVEMMVHKVFDELNSKKKDAKR